MNRYSILVKDMSVCCKCGRPREAIHEVFGGKNRQTSIKHGFCIPLCNDCHNMKDTSIHFNPTMALRYKQAMQRKYEETHSREEFIELIGRSYV